jgi:hypothetical protein
MLLREKNQIKDSATLDTLQKMSMMTLDNNHPSRLNLYLFLVISIHMADPD